MPVYFCPSSGITFFINFLLFFSFTLLLSTHLLIFLHPPAATFVSIPPTSILSTATFNLSTTMFQNLPISIFFHPSIYCHSPFANFLACYFLFLFWILLFSIVPASHKPYIYSNTATETPACMLLSSLTFLLHCHLCYTTAWYVYCFVGVSASTACYLIPFLHGATVTRRIAALLIFVTSSLLLSCQPYPSATILHAAVIFS